MQTLTANKIINNSEGFDRVGKVVYVKGRRDRIFRIIDNRHKAFYLDLFESKKLEPFFGTFLVPTSISSEYRGENGELVLEHNLIPDISYFYEWSREMIKAAGILFLDMAIKLIETGLFVKDSHAFNLTFIGKKAVFFDYGSIENNRGHIKTNWILEFFSNFLFPVKYFQISGGEKYREFSLHDLAKPLNWQRFLAFSALRPFHALKTLWTYIVFRQRCRIAKSPEAQIKILRQLRLILQRTRIYYPRTRWSNYYLPRDAKPNDSESNNQKLSGLKTLISEIVPRDLIDIGGNTGMYTEFVIQNCQTIKKSILTDYDEVAVDLAYKNSAVIGNCYVVNFRRLCQNQTVNWKPNKMTVYPSFQSRHKADLILMLALVHHLFYFQNVTLANVAHTLNELAQKWVIVEFITNDDVHVQKWFKKGIKPKNSYSLEHLKLELSKFFEILAISPSGNGREDRCLLLCQKLHLQQI